MKKLVSLLVILAMAVGFSAMAESVPSKTVEDLTVIEVVNKEGEIVEDCFVKVVDETEEASQEAVAICEAELAKIAESESVEAYFGEVKDAEGNVVELKGEEDSALSVLEFMPIQAGGFAEACGPQMLTMKFAAAQEENQEYAVLVGIVTENEDGTTAIEWKAFEATVVPAEETTDVSVMVELDEATILAIQENTALLAVVA